MNAQKFSKIGIGVTWTALALCGALAVSVSCAGGGGGTGGTAGGGQGGGGGGQGGSTTTTPPPECNASADSVCFSSGKASGVLSGYAWIALGAHDTATQPVCDNTANGGGAAEQITKDKPCPSSGGKTVWQNADKGLCLTGTVPKVGNDSSGSPDYTGYWGVELGTNADPTEGTTVDISGYTKVSFAFDTSAISPSPSGMVRGEIHVKGHTPADESYCATITPGTSVSLTSFNTKCWDGTGTNLTAADMKQIDNMGVQMSSNTSTDFTLTNFCWTGITFIK